MGQQLHQPIVLIKDEQLDPPTSPTHETWTYSHPDGGNIYYTVSLTLKVFIVDVMSHMLEYDTHMDTHTTIHPSGVQRPLPQSF